MDVLNRPTTTGKSIWNFYYLYKQKREYHFWLNRMINEQCMTVVCGTHTPVLPRGWLTPTPSPGDNNINNNNKKHKNKHMTKIRKNLIKIKHTDPICF